MFKRSKKKIVLAIMGSLVLLFAVTLSVIRAAVSPEQPLNAPRPSLVALSGRVTSLSPSQPQKASASICVRRAGRSTPLSPEQ